MYRCAQESHNSFTSPYVAELLKHLKEVLRVRSYKWQRVFHYAFM